MYINMHCQSDLIARGDISKQIDAWKCLDVQKGNIKGNKYKETATSLSGKEILKRLKKAQRLLLSTIENKADFKEIGQRHVDFQPIHGEGFMEILIYLDDCISQGEAWQD